eukprot:NODE_2126_length_671_cov_187.147910_g1793_i0.p2 GENE.NODE_2126_length_671_cov_187.147910_g1793_i0~~NODE_2126_length_671_cov_187.147910_g1793_i0.p2  ORF type:complete len:140 (+),score=43.72 NODE_2126_length_671_cov_187.147910_g1793_i0:24-422(+)
MGEESSELPLWGKRPLIAHVFRQPDRRAPIPIALGFTGLVLGLPWLVLLGLLGKAGADLKFWPSDFSGNCRALAFHGILAGMLLVLVLYWIQLTIFPALGILVALWLVAYLVRPRDLPADAAARRRAAAKTD